MNELLEAIEVRETIGDLTSLVVEGIAYDSRQVRPGDLFCCLVGTRSDGHRHAADAVARGAVAVVCEHRIEALAGSRAVQVCVAPASCRQVMARLAAAFWGHPGRSLTMVGVTGTNGKTTVTHLLGAVLRQAGADTTVVGTLSGSRTTPESPDLQRLLAKVRDRGMGHDGASALDLIERPAVVMEVSSHALVQARVDGICFDLAVFTNLSQDHLDYHGTMESYFAAKASLFTAQRARAGVVNASDPWGQRLLEHGEIPMVAVENSQVSDVVLEAGRSSFSWRTQRVTVSLTGAFNVTNALVAAEAAVALGIDPPVVARGLGGAASVPGRLEPVVLPGYGLSFTVLVDYAHTPAGLESVLIEARRIAAGRGSVLVVFGCGGDRDRGKRPQMGAVATRMADLVVLTSDNPRSEDPLDILAEVAAGAEPGEAAARASGRLMVEPDRREAIRRALGMARTGDVVLLAGKGHETTQEIGGDVVEFDDRRVALEELRALGLLTIDLVGHGD